MFCELINLDARVPERNGVGWSVFTPREFNLESAELCFLELGFRIQLPQDVCALLLGHNLLNRGVDALEFFNPHDVVCLGGLLGFNYLDEWGVLVKNLSGRRVEFKRGDQICQFILIKTLKEEILEKKNQVDIDKYL